MLNKIKVLVKYSILSQFKIINIKKRISENKAITFIFAILFVYIVFSAFGQAIVLAKLGIGNYIPVITFLTIMLISLISSFLRSRDEMYNFKNKDLFLTYPLKISWIVQSRFIVLYLFLLIISSLLSFPFLISYLIYVDMSILKIFYWIIVVIFTPIIPICISLIINTFLSKILSGFRNNNYLYNILALVLVVITLVFSIVFPLKFGNTEFNIYNLGDIITKSLNSTIKYIFSLKWIYNIFQYNSVLNLFKYICSSIALYLLTIFYINKKYLNININLGKKEKNIKKLNSDDFKNTNSILKTLYYKEVKTYFNSRIYLINTIIGSLLLIVVSIIVIIYGTRNLFEIFNVENTNNIFKIYPYIGAILVGMASTTHISISYEGNKIWFIKSMPILKKDFYNSKILLFFTIVIPSIIIFTISAIVSKFSIEDIIYSFLIPFVFMIFIAVLGILLNLKFLNYNWENETKLVKQNFHILVIFLIDFLIASLSILLIMKFPRFNNLINIVVMAFLLVLSFIMYKKALKKEF